LPGSTLTVTARATEGGGGDIIASMFQVRSAHLGKRIAHHEAGHCCAAISYGIPIVRVSIDADVPHVHPGHYRPPPGIWKPWACFV
jgi:hypothetical protein